MLSCAGIAFYVQRTERPKDPDNFEAKSDKISPNILVVIKTSKCSGQLYAQSQHRLTFHDN